MHACCEPESPCNAWCAREGSWHVDMSYLNAMTHTSIQEAAPDDWAALFDTSHHTWHITHGMVAPRFTIVAVRYREESEALQGHYPDTTHLSREYPYAYLLTYEVTYGAVPDTAGR